MVKSGVGVRSTQPENMFGILRNRIMKIGKEKSLKKTLRQLMVAATLFLLLSCNSTIPDSQLQKIINDRLVSTPRMSSVAVNVQNSVATLTGSVASENDKILAVTLSKVDGIKSINNTIIVVIPTPEPTPEIAFESEEISEPSLYDEALAEVEKFVTDHTRQCGELFYIQSNDALYACKRPFDFELDGKEFFPKELSEAEKLNGVDPLPIEWIGQFDIKMNLCRTSFLASTQVDNWTPWKDSETHKPKTITKVKGKWTIENQSDYGQGGKFVKIPDTCYGNSQVKIPNQYTREFRVK